VPSYDNASIIGASSFIDGDDFYFALFDDFTLAPYMVVSHARRLTLKLAASLDKIAQFCVFRRKCFRMATG
jgi:hypothetical protein